MIGKSGIIYDQSGSATGQNGQTTYSWLGNAYQVGSVDQIVANPLYFALGYWAFQGANQSGNNSARIPIDAISNDKVKKKLTPAFWRQFAGSHCGAVFGDPQGMTSMIPNYSLQVVQTKQGMTNLYHIGNPGVGSLTLQQVTGGGDPRNVSLTNYLNNFVP